MYTKRRQILVLLLVVSQLGCMTFGIMWASRWLHHSFSQVIHRTAVAQARSTVLDVARSLTEQPGDVANADPARLKQLCEQTSKPYGGFTSILQLDSGVVIYRSHDQQPSRSRPRAPFSGRTPLVTASNHAKSLLEALRQAEENHQPLIAGQMELGGERYEATALSLPQLNAAVFVALPEAGIQQVVAQLVAPLTHVGFVLTAAVVGATGLCTVLLVRRFDDTLHEVSSSVEREVDRRTLALQRSRNAVVFGLAKLAESRDKDARQHLERVRTYVTILATELAKHNQQIDHHYVANLATASSLHDVGKMGVPDAVILKLGKLTSAERRAMQMHTVLGDECLASIERMLGKEDLFLKLGREIAAAHHEQWDGSGYPYGLQGKDIPLSARIVALADVYDALTSHRVYRPAVSHEEAREWIVSNYGSQFDPEVVEAFIARERDFAKISRSIVWREDNDVDGAQQTDATPQSAMQPTD